MLDSQNRGAKGSIVGSLILAELDSGLSTGTALPTPNVRHKKTSVTSGPEAVTMRFDVLPYLVSALLCGRDICTMGNYDGYHITSASPFSSLGQARIRARHRSGKSVEHPS